MEGVTILNEFEVVTEMVFSWTACWIGVLIGVVIALTAGIVFGLQEDSFGAFLLMFITVSIFASLLIGYFAGGIACPKPVAYETHYEVSVNEEVNMKDFMDKYEILETRGSIYTVREK